MVLCVEMADVSGLTVLVLWQLKTQKNFYWQGTLCNKGENNCQRQRLGISETSETPLDMPLVQILQGKYVQRSMLF